MKKQKQEDWEKELWEKIDFKIYDSPTVKNAEMAKLLKEHYDQWIKIIRTLLAKEREECKWEKEQMITEMNRLCQEEKDYLIENLKIKEENNGELIKQIGKLKTREEQIIEEVRRKNYILFILGIISGVLI